MGKEFIVVFPRGQSREKKRYKIIITADTTTTVQLSSQYPGINSSVEIKTGVYIFEVPESFVKTTMTKNWATIYIKAYSPISVVAFQSFCDTHSYTKCNFDAFLSLPISNIGQTYVPSTYPGQKQSIAIASTNSNTTVTIQYASGTSLPNLPGKTFVNDTHKVTTFNLFRYQSICFTTESSLVGTRIHSSKPVLVVAGNSKIHFRYQESRYSRPYDYNSIAYETVLPQEKWGQSFIIPNIEKSAHRTLHVTSASDTTVIRLEWVVFGSYKKSEFQGTNFMTNLTENGIYTVTSSRPVSLTLYSFTEHRTSTFMTVTPALKHYSNNFVVAPSGLRLVADEYVSIIVKTDNKDGLQFIGSLSPNSEQTISIGATSYTVKTMKMAGTSVYKIRHPSPKVVFGVIVYGYGSSEGAYGYPAGLRL